LIAFVRTGGSIHILAYEILGDLIRTA